MGTIEVHRIGTFQTPEEISLEPFTLDDYFRNYFYLHLNRSYIRMTWWGISNSSVSPISQPLTLNPRAFFKEASIDYEIIQNDAL